MPQNLNDLEKLQRLFPTTKQQQKAESLVKNTLNILEGLTGRKHTLQDDDFLNECQPDKNKNKKTFHFEIPL